MTEKIDIKAQVTAGTCTFVRFRKGELWYRSGLGFEFPVPVDDVGDATFGAEEKGTLMMRYMRKHAEALEMARKEMVETVYGRTRKI